MRAFKFLRILFMVIQSVGWWCFFISHEGYGREATHMFAAYAVFGATGACVAIASFLLKKPRFVLENISIFLACPLMGAFMGDPVMYGSYDHHGGADTLFGWAVGGMGGAAIGAGVILVRHMFRSITAEFPLSTVADQPPRVEKPVNAQVPSSDEM